MISLLRHLYAVIGYLENIFRKNNYFFDFYIKETRIKSFIIP